MKIISGIIFTFWSSLIIILYYTKNISHIGKTLSFDNSGSLSPLFMYFAIILLFYSGYKIFTHIKNKNNWNFFTILGGFFFQLLVVCILYTNLINIQDNFTYQPFALFGHIFTFTLYPLFLVLLWRSIGKSIFYFWKYWENIPLRISLLIETTIGFGIFALILGIIGKLGHYNTTTLIIIIIGLSVISFSGWKDTVMQICFKKIQNTHNPLSFYTISAEISFILFSFVASVSFINTLRPMPIGWDDLGVYMNFPKIIATTGMLLEGAGMYTWQLVTGTGFLLGNNATQAFFINQIGGILATIAIISGISFFLSGKENEKKFICLPMLLGIVYYLLPMTVFQQAKDMKLDPMLLFITISSFLAIILVIREFYAANKNLNNSSDILSSPNIKEFYVTNENLDNSSSLKNIFLPLFNFKENSNNFILLFFIAGILTGITFGVKLTSLILILSLLAFIHYRILGLIGFFGFTGIFIAIFTKFDLWAHMFVNIGAEFSEIIWFIGGILGLICYSYSWLQEKNTKKFKKFFSGIIIFCFGIGLAILPWTLHNFSLFSGEKFSINTILNGNSEGKENGTLSIDYEQIYTKEELEKRKNENNFSTITTDGTSNNEDFGRYFGQEKGLNNYLKLPINLTLQKNQTGEFTDITYIFLAFVPVVLLFLNRNYKAEWFSGIVFFLILGSLTFFHITFPHSEISRFITQFFSEISLPFGYLILGLLVFGFLTFAHFIRKNENQEITGILIFTGFYGFIFWISAFGIVWYGITIYFAFLLIIALGLESLNTSRDISSKIILSIFTFFLSIYLIGSAQIHAFSNLKTAGYNEYKYHIVPQNTSIFLYKREYFENILTLNIKNDEKLKENLIKEITNSDLLSSTFQKNFPHPKESSLLEIHEWLQQNLVSVLRGTKTHEIQIRTEISRILEPFYENILYPHHDQENNGKIYRIGTFLTYFINKNRSRYYEDSLLQNFQTYFYEEDFDKTIENMKKVGMKYLLIDLNAATIDNGEFRLTKRYENLLKSLRSKKLKLINTDSSCLRIALDEYHNNNISLNEYLKIAGVNYRNFFGNQERLTTMSPQEKLNFCGNQIVKIFQNEQFFIKQNIISTTSGKTYPNSQEIIFNLGKAGSGSDFQEKLIQILSRNSWFALFEIQ